ncbi:hypothetical protein D3C84_1074620 [compost metagenome]
MELAISADVTFRAYHDGRIVKLVSHSLREAGDYINVALPSNVFPRLSADSSWNCLC